MSLGPFDGTKSSIDIALQRYYASAEAKAHGRVASSIELDEEMGAPTDGRVHNSGGHRVREVMRRYDEERMTKVRPVSRVNWNTYSKSFEAAIGDRLIKSITQPMIEKWLRELVETVRLTASPGNQFAGHPTFNNAKKCITAFFGWAVKRKLADENPALHIELMKAPPTRRCPECSQPRPSKTKSTCLQMRCRSPLTSSCVGCANEAGQGHPQSMGT